MLKMLIIAMNLINYHLQAFGFKNSSEFMDSTFHFKQISGGGFLFIGALGTISTLFMEYVGMTPVVYGAFLFLLIGEFLTGISASLHHRKKIQSRKFGRMIIKIGVYTIILAILHTFEVGLSGYTILGMDINVYRWLYYLVLNMIIFQLVISVFENLDAIGLTESHYILKALKKRFEKWFLLDEKDTNKYD